ncbi:MAG: rhodanese-like domain-containing protein [Myxococcota bacterium]|nr:rhodanese-like domain-containing protein [Myxococcota bacterium]
MATNFGDRVQAGQANVDVLTISDAKQAIEANADALIIDVRDAGDLAATGVIPGSINISLGSLFYKADQTMPEGIRDDRLADKGQTIFVTCALGGQASIAAGVLNDYGYENVSVIDGGIVGWKDAGLDAEDV